jgi:hypothetical protein
MGALLAGVSLVALGVGGLALARDAASRRRRARWQRDLGIPADGAGAGSSAGQGGPA